MRSAGLSHPGPASREQWIGDEDRMALAARRVLARALRRPGRVLAVALLATAAYVASRAWRAPSYEATLFFRLSEGDLTDPRNAPRPPSAIREYLSNVALSRTRVEQIMRRHGISEGYLARNREAAIDDFREEIKIEVGRNYFIYDRRPDEPPRSALVTISLSGADADKARAMLHEIGDAILQEQMAQREARLAQAREHLRAQLKLVRDRTGSLQRDLERLWKDLPDARGHEAVEIRAQIVALQTEAKGAIDRSLALERRAADVAFNAAAESAQLGLNFELFDESLVAAIPRLTPLQLLGRAVLVMATGLLLAVPVVGAFEDRIYTREDLAARGLPQFGALPGFPGDDVGSYRTRSRSRRA